jgi:hypothetical protein
MIRSFRLIGTAIAALAVLALAGGPAGAGDGRVPLPELAKPQGEKCVEPTDVIRRNHPDFLKTQRDETMHLGIRDGKYSLTGCIECHAAADPKAADPTVKSIEPFCEQCHAYAAVKLDCWSCHNPKLTPAVKQAAQDLPLATDRKALVAQLKAHLAEGGAAK